MIGVIDSGLGGANVINECIKFYNEDFVYLIDNKNCPYGNLPYDRLKIILEQNIAYLLKNYDPDFIILACNTLSAIVDFNMELKIKTPILKTNPSFIGIKGGGENCLIFATKNTIKNNKKIKLLKLNYKNVETLYIKGLPKLIDDYLVYKNERNKNIINKLLKNKLKLNKYKNVKYISLGCTHFKHIKQQIGKIFNDKVDIFECEQEVAKISKWLVRKKKQKSSVKIIFSEPNEEMLKTAREILDVQKISFAHMQEKDYNKHHEM